VSFLRTSALEWLTELDETKNDSVGRSEAVCEEKGNPTLIEMRQLELRYPNGEIGLASTTLTIRDGEMMVLEGGSGAGKSSCLAIMSGRTRPTAGSLVVNSQNVMAMSKSELINWWRMSGVVRQESPLHELRTVQENIEYGLAVAKPSSSTIDHDAGSLLSAFGLDDLGNRLPTELSGGERARAALAQALAKRPAIVFLDEPTANLDPKSALTVVSVLNEHCLSGMTCVVATHNLGVFRPVLTRQAHVVKGTVREVGQSA
jgi:ABC-type ATPase involved in cell division